MTKIQILEEIYKSGYEDEIFLELSLYLIREKETIKNELTDANATLKLISKVTKDDTVKDILEVEE